MSSPETLKRVRCEVEPKRPESPPWNPARRICSFMLLVSLICTLLVVGIVLVALLLSHRGQHETAAPHALPLQVVPTPRLRTPSTRPAIWADRSHWRPLAAELEQLLSSYQHPRNQSSLLQGLSPNCSRGSPFGYQSGSPCVALLLLDAAGDRRLSMTCRSSPKTPLSTPAPVFTLGTDPPPFVMLQVVRPPINTQITVTCLLRSPRFLDPASFTFEIVVL